MEAVRQLESDGYNCHYLDVDTEGNVQLDQLIDICRVHKGNISIVSIMGANNEVGTVQNLKKIAEIVHNEGNSIFHSDCAQLVGK